MFRTILILSFCVLVLATTAVSAAESHHAKLRIPLDSPGAAAFVRDNAGWLDILFVKPGVEAHVAARPRDLARLRDAGLTLEVLQADMEVANAYPVKGDGFGVYHTYSESVAFVDSLRLLYPNVISEKWSLGSTVEGRQMWAFRVSDNPDLDEAEPEILIDGMHHAREIMAGEFVIMFAEYLAQGYGSDPEITWLLDNRELYLVPMVNPDGIVYNETIEPDGGGMWRKNRRLNDDESYGVDLNRNYPYEWGYDDVGSSPIPDDVTYRGIAPGSEVETQHMMAFINAREFRVQDTIHTYSNLTLFPWGYGTDPTPDDAIYRHMGAEMTKFNGYLAGQPIDAINYTANGGTIDWTYGDTTDHDAIFAFSNEIGAGSDGFWPAESRRGALFRDNIWPHLYLMRAAGAFVTAKDAVVIADGPITMGDKSIAPGESGTLDFTLENQSAFDTSAPVSLTVRTDDAWIQLAAAVRTIGGLAPLGSTDLSADPIPLTINAACPDGHIAHVTVTIGMPEGDLDFPLSFVVGTPVEIFADDFESGTGNWTLSDDWATTTTEAYSPSTSLTDSPSGDYGDQNLTTATLNGTWAATELRFWHRFEIEAGYDYGRVQVSVDGGDWQTVVSFDGTQSGWTEVVVDLSAYAGGDLAIRFALDTDYSVTEDGWYIDDVSLIGDPSMSFDMAVPVPAGPSGGVSVGPTSSLAVYNAAGSGGPATVYGFRVYDDELCTNLVAAADGVPAGESTTRWTTPFLANDSYWWRAWAGDGVDRSDLSGPTWFNVFDLSPVSLTDVLGLRVLGNVGDGGSRLELSLPATADVTLDIHDARGARVRRLHSGTLAGGTRVLGWDGRDGRGRHVASGVYFVRATVGARALTGRLILVR